MSRIQEKKYFSCRAGTWYFHCYDSYGTAKKKQSLTHNHRPQLGPQLRHHHDQVQKNWISYAVGLMWSITYPRICLVNRKTDIVAKMALHIGIEEKWEVQRMYDPHFLVKGLTPMGLLQRVLHYVQPMKVYVFWYLFLPIPTWKTLFFSLDVFFQYPEFHPYQFISLSWYQKTLKCSVPIVLRHNWYTTF